MNLYMYLLSTQDGVGKAALYGTSTKASASNFSAYSSENPLPK